MHNLESPRPRNDDEALELTLQAKGLNAPRISPSDVEGAIRSEHYFTAADGVVGAMTAAERSVKAIPTELMLLTFCTLVLHNGFTVTGHSSCASPENFDAGVGRDVARKDAIRQVWPHLGYALKSVLHEARAQELRDLQG